ncbi:MAG: hypothetical protein LBC72_04290, partial [Spirochaetaceae bacterium]|nr:hypothetical protein [Spirochaetaceae bacterium]
DKTYGHKHGSKYRRAPTTSVFSFHTLSSVKFCHNHGVSSIAGGGGGKVKSLWYILNTEKRGRPGGIPCLIWYVGLRPFKFAFETRI